MTVPEALARVLAGGDLSEAESAALWDRVLAGEVTPAQLGGLLIALRMKGETTAELAGAVRALRARAVPIPDVPPGTIDTCGTGGDGAGTFNVSTAAALVAAGAGVPVAKHGNRAMSGAVGGADVLEALGVAIELPPPVLAACLRRVGFAFLFAPALHPGLRHAAAARRELGVRTLFNLVAPLANPAGVRRQLVGVADPARIEQLATVLARAGAERAWVVSGENGLDELGLEGESRVAELLDGVVRVHTVRAAEVGLAPAPAAALRVASAAESARRVRSVLEGERGPARDVVCLNAGAALVVAGVVADLAAGVARAAAAIDSGAARAVLERLIAFTAAAEAEAAP